MDVFSLRDRVVGGYASFVRSFVELRDQRIRETVESQLAEGRLWPEPLVQLNPAFEPGEELADLVTRGALHRECLDIFRRKSPDDPTGPPIRLYKHQVDAIEAARAGENYVLTTGTGSGKSLAYIVPIVDHVLRERDRGAPAGIKAIVVYPMNALANSQEKELEKFLCLGFAQDHPPVTFRRYTGQEDSAQKKEIIRNPPDILLTNFVMLELILTRFDDRNLVKNARDLRFLVFDELHTYRGRQGADVAALIRRTREECGASNVIHVGTSATLAGAATWADQQREVSQLATLLFGAPVRPERVIGETLRRRTRELDFGDPAVLVSLRESVLNSRSAGTSVSQAVFAGDPLASWVESTIGLTTEASTETLRRAMPRPLNGPAGVVAELENLTGLDTTACSAALGRILLTRVEPGPGGQAGGASFGFPIRLHQFFSKGETVHATLEPEPQRHLTLDPQAFAPGSEKRRILLPLAFCRECGQEYYVVRRIEAHGAVRYQGRDLRERSHDEDQMNGYLFLDSENPWPETLDDAEARLPESWFGPDGTILDSRRNARPRFVRVDPEGREDLQIGIAAAFLAAPFKYCVRCRVDHASHRGSEFSKLATLGNEGRSSATTILSLETMSSLTREEDLSANARKLLSFTDNRQDASLQAGHFNDFVVVAMVRAAIRRALVAAAHESLGSENIAQAVRRALGLRPEDYIKDATKLYGKDKADRALANVLGYFVFRDLQRGWRVTSPNLEQCGLLEIDYENLDDAAGNPTLWASTGAPLADATSQVRSRIMRALLDFMRRELAVDVNYLEPEYQLSSIRQLSSQNLIDPWVFDERENLESRRTVLPRPESRNDRNRADAIYLSPRSAFARLLVRELGLSARGNSDQIQSLISDVLRGLTTAGLAREVDAGGEPGYRVAEGAMLWKPGAGQQGYHDPIRIPNPPEGGVRVNPFFRELYGDSARQIRLVEAREHTAQVPAKEREDREERFRRAELPVLFCSPTMELGVDIAELNVVNMRNVPPTPANYAQRSGRAGRNGQPAFVTTYCTSGSPHDQYFFRHPLEMVSGSVATPRLDLANEDLLRAHVHAIWLSQAGLSLGSSLKDILDTEGDQPTLAIQGRIAQRLSDPASRGHALTRAETALGPDIARLPGWTGTSRDWIERVLAELPQSFEQACERWRSLFRSAKAQFERQNKIAAKATASQKEREEARRLRAEAEKQIDLLSETEEGPLSDFYSYRYFASEGFLPGYSFPRLPLSAYIPGYGRKREQDHYLNRPRFLAITEFGPRSIIYHEGARYVVTRVILPIDDAGNITSSAKLCTSCGYLHPVNDTANPDLCEHCDATLPPAMDALFRMQSVVTRRRQRISSDEEERVRLGYDIRTAVRFAERSGEVSCRVAALEDASGGEMATLTYGSAATIRRINVGWKRRRGAALGFHLDLETGTWERSPDQDATDDTADQPGKNQARVIPFVEDRRNVLLIEPSRQLDESVFASLEAALKRAVQAEFQLEDSEIAVDALPNFESRRVLLLYESAEGGAGVLRRLVDESGAFQQVCRRAIDLCHFDPASGADRRRAVGAREDCVAACYDCLLSYSNQMDHERVDRHRLLPVLQSWAGGTLSTSPAATTRGEHAAGLRRLCQSTLEERFLDELERRNLRLPEVAQQRVDSVHVQPDFSYPSQHAVVFIDGPHHDEASQEESDAENDARLEDAGYTVIRFRHDENWDGVFARYSWIFGEPAPHPVAAPPSLDLFHPVWRPLVERLAGRSGYAVRPGGDVADAGRVIGASVMVVGLGARQVIVLDARDTSSPRLAEVLGAGNRVLSVDPTDSGAETRVVMAVEEAS